MGHAIFQHQVREIRESQQPRLLTAQIEDAGDQRAVVPFGRRPAHRVGQVDLAADGGIVEISHHREVIGRLQGETPALPAFARGALARRGERGGRQPGQLRLVGDQDLEGVGGIQHVLRKLGGEPGQLDVDLFQPLLARSVQVGAVTAEIVHGFGQEALPLARETGAFRGGGIRLDPFPQPCLKGDARVERADLRLHGVERGAQFRVGGHRLQVPHHSHGAIQRFRQVVQRAHGVGEGALAGLGGDGIQARARLAQQFRGGGLDVGGAYAVEWNSELKRKERIRLAGVRHSIQSVTGAFNELQNGYHRESMGSDENGVPGRVPAGSSSMSLPW